MKLNKNKKARYINVSLTSIQQEKSQVGNTSLKQMVHNNHYLALYVGETICEIFL